MGAVSPTSSSYLSSDMTVCSAVCALSFSAIALSNKKLVEFSRHVPTSTVPYKQDLTTFHSSIATIPGKEMILVDEVSNTVLTNAFSSLPSIYKKIHACRQKQVRLFFTFERALLVDAFASRYDYYSYCISSCRDDDIFPKNSLLEGLKPPNLTSILVDITKIAREKGTAIIIIHARNKNRRWTIEWEPKLARPSYFNHFEIATIQNALDFLSKESLLLIDTIEQSIFCDDIDLINRIHSPKRHLPSDWSVTHLSNKQEFREKVIRNFTPPPSGTSTVQLNLLQRLLRLKS